MRSYWEPIENLGGTPNTWKKHMEQIGEHLNPIGSPPHPNISCKRKNWASYGACCLTSLDEKDFKNYLEPFGIFFLKWNIFLIN
jgi:hypothetical protein